MGCIRVTPRPSYYQELALMKKVPPEEPTLEDKITVSFHVGGVGGLLGTRKQAWSILRFGMAAAKAAGLRLPWMMQMNVSGSGKQWSFAGSMGSR